MMPSREAGELPLSPIEEILADLQAGKGVVVLDDVGRENEGDVIFATEAVTPEAVAFLMREARGLICVSVSSDVARRLNLPLQVTNNNSPHQTPFAVSVDHRDVVPVGVTAEARSRTMRALLDPLSVGCPPVVREGNTARCRQSAALLREIGLDVLVTRSAAVRLPSDDGAWDHSFYQSSLA